MGGKITIDDQAALRLLLQRDTLEVLERAGIEAEVVLRARAGDTAETFASLRETLAGLQDRALVKMAALGLVGAGVTHEARNAMTGVLGFAQLVMKRWPPQSPAALELIQGIERESGRVVQLLNNFLHFTGSGMGARDRVDIAEVARSVVQVVSHRAQMDGVEVKLIVEDGVPEVAGDAGELRQVVLNLVLNALQASARGGELRIQAARGGDGWAQIRVADDGHGIASVDESKLFSPFFTTKPSGEGTGLGLYVSKRIVEEHGGTIAVATEVGRGTTFTVRLPPRERG
jgi:two-component system, NtrC family, sensor kinase